MTNQEKITIGQMAPDFALDANTGDEWRLSDYRGNVVALLFYPGDETIMCTKQLCSVRDNWSEYLETKAEIVGVSPGGTDQHRAFAEHHNLPLKLLADMGRKVTGSYIAHWLWPLSFMRSVVVVDAKGIVRSSTPMLRAFRPSDKSVIASIYAARADKFTDDYKKLVEEAREMNK